MGGITSYLAAKMVFFPPNPPTYTLIADSVTNELKMSCVPECENVDVLKLPTERGQEIVAIYVRNPAAKLTLLYSHGNVVDLGPMYSFLREMSSYFQVNVMGYDYSGYGQSTGKPNEKNCYADIEAGFKCLREKYGVEEEQLVLYGQSIGSGPTVDLAARINKLGGVVLQGAMLSGLRVIFPVKKTYCFDIFSNVDKIGRVNCPVLVMHGTLDEVVDFSHGEKLWDLCKEKFEPLWIIRGGHNDLESFRVFTSHLKNFFSSMERRLILRTTREEPYIGHLTDQLTYATESQPSLPVYEENKALHDDEKLVRYDLCLVSQPPNLNNGSVKHPQDIRDSQPSLPSNEENKELYDDDKLAPYDLCLASQPPNPSEKSPDAHNLLCQSKHHSTLASEPSPSSNVCEGNKTPDDNHNPCPNSNGSQPPFDMDSKNKTYDDNQSPCSVKKSTQHLSAGPQVSFPIHGNTSLDDNQSPLRLGLSTHLSFSGAQSPVHICMENNHKTVQQALSGQIYNWKNATKEEGSSRNFKIFSNPLSLRN